MKAGTVKSFKAGDGIEIAFQKRGEETSSPPIVLHHRFLAAADSNWVGPGVIKALRAAGRGVFPPDPRGHGHSEKPHDPGRYEEQRMAWSAQLQMPRCGSHASHIGAIADPKFRRSIIDFLAT